MVNAKSHIQLGQQCICSHGTSTAMALSNNVVGSPTKSHCESRNFEQRQKQLMKHAGFTTLPNYANLCRTPSNAFYENASKICERLEEKEKARKSSSECLDHARGCISYARPGDTQESSGLQSDDVVIDRSLTNWLCTPEENLNKLLEPPNSTCVSSISNNLLSDTNVEERQCSKTSGNINFRNVKIDKTASRQASFKHDYANYLLMHPVFAQVSTNDTITDTNLKRQKKEGDPSNSCDLSKHELPLRPFMPLDITKVGHPRCFECGCIPSYKSPNDISVSSSNHHTIRNRPLRRNKSYSMIEVSSKVVVEKRSSSADATRSAFITSEALKGDHFNDDLLPTVADMSLSASRKTWSSAENVINVKNMTSGYTSRTCVDSIMAHVNGNSCSVGELIDETDSLIAARRRQDCTVPYTSNRNSTSSSDSGVSSGSPNKMNTLRENE